LKSRLEEFPVKKISSKNMQSDEIRSRFLKFFEKRGHKIIPSASLVPENDPSVLFTTAGMHPLIPYLLGESHPMGVRLASVQKCVRTQDIDEVGDKTHDTFFEMLGNWSLGDYFKKDAIKWSYEFLTSQEEGLGLDVNRLYFTCFEGDENSTKDIESASIWESLGIQKDRIYFLGAGDNWWSPGDNGPCGPDSEMFYDITGEMGDMSKEEFINANDEQKVVEIWNDVFMEYEKKDGKITGKLKKQNVDTGAGLERISMVMQKTDNIFDTDLFALIVSKINELTVLKDERAKRIIADHIRTAVFMISAGIAPARTAQGYILRRLLRRAVRYADILEMEHGSLLSVADAVIEKYGSIYEEVFKKRGDITTLILDEETQFRKTLKQGLKEFEKGIDPFILFTTYGFPIELTLELAKEKGISIDLENFNKQMKAHVILSQTSSAGMFKGGLADAEEETKKLHTATHLMRQALEDVLGEKIVQKGSNITAERLRFDFTFSRKLTDEEKRKVEDVVNEKIKLKLPVQKIIMKKEDAEKTGAEHIFGGKYGDEVSIYYVGETLESAYSKEFCGGPHVNNTSELGVFKILKEEAVAQGIRRIKAVLE
jgi:alanyl-tRNA synthetase